MPCAYCHKDKKLSPVMCSVCAEEHQFCLICKKKKEPAALSCLRDSHRITRTAASKILERAKEANQRDKDFKETLKECKKARAYKPPLDAVLDPAAFGPADEADIINNPLRYVGVRANEIWKAYPTLFGQTTACVTIIECGNVRSVMLTSCVEGPNPHAALRDLAKVTEEVPAPDPIVHRVRHKLKEGEKKKGAKKPKDTVFVARSAASNPVKAAGIDQNPDYASAEKSMAKRGYTVTSLYPGPDPNETHAEQRAIALATARGCTIIAQAPTIGCCDECRRDLGDVGLAKVPTERQSSALYSDYKNKTLLPTFYAK